MISQKLSSARACGSDLPAEHVADFHDAFHDQESSPANRIRSRPEISLPATEKVARSVASQVIEKEQRDARQHREAQGPESRAAALGGRQTIDQKHQRK
jgi:hypothetical protein